MELKNLGGRKARLLLVYPDYTDRDCSRRVSGGNYSEGLASISAVLKEGGHHVGLLHLLNLHTEEDYKEAEREMAGKMKKKKSGNGSQVRPVRSLHYIDDEDFEDTRERGLARKAAIEEREKQEQEEKAQSTPFGKISLKKDDRADQAPKQETEAAEQLEDGASQEEENNKE